MFCNSTTAVSISLVITLILQRWRWPTVHEMVYVMLAGVSYASGHKTMFYALKVETATVVYCHTHLRYHLNFCVIGNISPFAAILDIVHWRYFDFYGLHWDHCKEQTTTVTG
ncbi:hypothetical protein HOLleu_04404 [Holothuria leucospilota]|uniref:Uncharacterized protein n=1 Tax=Holothuria leucospilota TaxID=206669 RepID=A0A9Q1HLV2_HOLLE|nr:hypothetical protein HOLleu_04404 [Holothuria leucospilota]